MKKENEHLFSYFTYICDGIKICFCVAVLIISKKLPVSVFSQFKLRGSLDSGRNNSEEFSTSFEIEKRSDIMKFFSFEIDKKQSVDENGNYSHKIQIYYQEEQAANQKEDLSLSEKRDLKNSQILLESLLNSDEKTPSKYIKKETRKTEKELITFAQEIKKIESPEKVDTFFDNFGKTDLNISNLQETVNKFMNEYRHSIIHEQTKEKKFQLVSKFLGITWNYRSSNLWLKKFSLCTEFPSHFMITAKDAEVIFPNFLVQSVMFTNKDNVFKLSIYIRNERKKMSIIRSLEQIERFAKSQFPKIKLPSNTDNINFIKEIKYLLNVCLNEATNESFICKFLNKKNVTIIPFNMDIPKINLEIESFYGFEEDGMRYKLSFEFGFISLKKSEVIRNLKQFELLSHNLQLRFGSEYVLRPEMFLNINYIKNWLEKMFENELIWRSTEFKIFINYFNTKSKADSISKYHGTFTTKSKSEESNSLGLSKSNDSQKD